MMRRTLCFLMAAVLVPAVGAAQTGHTDKWPGEFGICTGCTVGVVTVAEPTKVQSCRVEEVKPDELVCGRRWRKSVVFPRGEVAALIEPGSTDRPLLWFFGVLGVSGGLVAGAVFLASVTVVGAIPVAVLGGLFALASPLAFMDGTKTVHIVDSVIYQQPGQVLQVRLR